MTHNAYAATECVQLNPSTTTCEPPKDNGNTQPSEWTANCTTNGVKQKIVGVGFCANESGTFGTAKESVTGTRYWENYLENKYCWCKMIYPAISDWIYLSYWTNEGMDCLTFCNANCAGALGDNDYQDEKYLEKYLFSHIHQY